MNDRLYRSVDDRVLAGVAGGLADRMGIDPSIVRIVWALLAIASGGVFILIYIVMAIVVPEEDDLAVFPPMPPAMPSAPASGAPGEAAPGVAGAAPAGAAPAGTWAGMGVAPQPMSAAQWREQARAERRAARLARRAERGPGQGALVFGVILILLGSWFLLREYVPAVDLDRLWPFALLILGLVLLAFSFGGRPGGSSEGQK